MIDLPNTRTFTTVEEYDAAGRAYLLAVLARERDLDCGPRIWQTMAAEPLKRKRALIFVAAFLTEQRE